MSRKVKEKIAYLKGMFENSEQVQADPGSRALWGRLLEALDEIADSAESLGSRLDDYEEYVDAIDADLCDLEEEVFLENDDEDLDGYGEEVDESEDELADYGDEELGDGSLQEASRNFIELECPACHELLFVEEDLLRDGEAKMECPGCGGNVPPVDVRSARDPRRVRVRRGGALKGMSTRNAERRDEETGEIGPSPAGLR